MTASRYFELGELGYSDATRMAFGVTHEQRFIHRLTKPGRVQDPPELTWEWQSAVHAPDDVVFTDDGIRLVSPTVRRVFDEHLTDADEIQWLPATLVTPAKERLPHWVPHFPVHHDLLDRDRSTFGPSGLAIRYVFAADKLAPHAVTVMAGRALGYVVGAAVADALRAAEITGARITPAPVA